MTLRGQTITAFGCTEFVTETCYKCGVPFAMEASYARERQNDHSRHFYCPNGHSQVYAGKTPEQKAREEAERYRQWMADAEQERDEERRAHAATKGKLTRTTKRIAGGVCPCCNRSFENLQRHMHTKHPTYAEADGVPPRPPHPSEIVGGTLRERVIAVLADGEPHTAPEIAERLGAKLSTVRQYLSQINQTDTAVTHPAAGTYQRVTS